MAEKEQEQAPETTTLEIEAQKETIAEVAQRIASEVKGDAVVEKAFVELSDADKVLVSQIENSFLKIQLELHQHQSEIQRLQNLAKEIQNKFKTETETLFKKYNRTVESDILDVATFGFRKRTPQETQK